MKQAAKNDHIEVVKLLLELGGGLDAMVPPDDGGSEDDAVDAACGGMSALFGDSSSEEEEDEDVSAGQGEGCSDHGSHIDSNTSETPDGDDASGCASSAAAGGGAADLKEDEEHEEDEEDWRLQHPCVDITVYKNNPGDWFVLLAAARAGDLQLLKDVLEVRRRFGR